jgi:hypothetical protein
MDLTQTMKAELGNLLFQLIAKDAEITALQAELAKLKQQAAEAMKG